MQTSHIFGVAILAVLFSIGCGASTDEPRAKYEAKPQPKSGAPRAQAEEEKQKERVTVKNQPLGHQLPMDDGWYLAKSKTGRFSAELPAPYKDTMVEMAKGKALGQVHTIRAIVNGVKIQVWLVESPDKATVAKLSPFDGIESEYGEDPRVTISRQQVEVAGRTFDYIMFKHSEADFRGYQIHRDEGLYFVGFEFHPSKVDQYLRIHQRVLQSIKFRST